MTVAANTVTVSHTAPTQIVPPANANANASGQRFGDTTVVITNLDGAITVYLGGSAVTSSGYPLLKGASVTLSLGAGDSVYGLAASGSPSVAYIVTG